MFQTVDLLRWGVRTLGIEGVSTVALVGLLSVALYAHKLTSVGGLAVSAGSTAAHDAKIVAVVLAALLVLGVISADVERLQELVTGVPWRRLLEEALGRIR